MNKNRIEGRPRRDELAPHSEVDGPDAEVNAAVVPGSNAFLPGEAPLGQPDGESAEAVVPSSEPDTQRPEDSMPGRAEPNRNVPTPWRTSPPMKPEGQGAMSAATAGSMGTLRSKT